MVCRKEISFFDSHYIMRKNRKKEEKFDELSIILLLRRKSRRWTAGCTNGRGKPRFRAKIPLIERIQGCLWMRRRKPRPNGSLTCFSHCVSILCENTSKYCKKHRIARCTVWTALFYEILYKMNKFDMKRQDTASQGRIKTPRPCRLDKAGAYAII